MTNENELIVGELVTPSTEPKAGWATSQGQLTAIFTVVSMLLAFLGWKFSPEQVDNIYQLILTLLTVVGPLLVNVPILKDYINSRGKIQSNAIWADASVKTGGSTGNPPVPLAGLNMGKIFKDPKTYGKILDIVNDTGIVPGPAGKILDSIVGDKTADEVAEIVQVLQNHEARLRTLEGQK